MKRALIVIVGLMAVIPSSFEWGKEGHELIGKIASELIKKTTASRIKSLMTSDCDGESYSMWSTWPDRVKRNGFGWTSKFHFANTPDWQCHFHKTTDCEGGCITTALANFSQVAVDESVDKLERQQALKFTMHFAEDLHQPMHISFASDKGGNSITGHFLNRQQNLHTVWDDSILAHTIKDVYANSADDYAAAMLKRAKSERSKVSIDCSLPSGILTCADVWADETSELACKYGYTQPNGKAVPNDFVLGQEYMDAGAPIVDQQIVKAAVRLAAILDSMFETTTAEI